MGDKGTEIMSSEQEQAIATVGIMAAILYSTNQIVQSRNRREGCVREAILMYDEIRRRFDGFEDLDANLPSQAPPATRESKNPTDGATGEP